MRSEITKRQVITAALIAGAVVLFIAALVVSRSSEKPKPAHHSHAQVTHAGSSPAPVADLVPPGLTALAHSWAKRYVAYLNGAPASTLGSLASQGGGRPNAGQRIKVTSVNVTYNIGDTSAPITVMAVGEGAKFPFTLTASENPAAQWIVTGITPPDITQDQVPTTTGGPRSQGMPSAGAQAATKQFVLQYANYRANHGPMPSGMSGSSGVQMQQGTDPLNGVTLATGAVQIVSAQFAPPSGNEFTGTVILRFHDGKRFAVTVMMQGTSHGWVCADFIGATNPGSTPGTPA